MLAGSGSPAETFGDASGGGAEASAADALGGDAEASAADGGAIGRLADDVFSCRAAVKPPPQAIQLLDQDLLAFRHSSKLFPDLGVLRLYGRDLRLKVTRVRRRLWNRLSYPLQRVRELPP